MSSLHASHSRKNDLADDDKKRMATQGDIAASREFVGQEFAELEFAELEFAGQTEQPPLPGDAQLQTKTFSVAERKGTTPTGSDVRSGPQILVMGVIPSVPQSSDNNRQFALLLMGVVGFVLLIACTSIASLQFARASVRHGNCDSRSSRSKPLARSRSTADRGLFAFVAGRWGGVIQRRLVAKP